MLSTRMLSPRCQWRSTSSLLFAILIMLPGCKDDRGERIASTRADLARNLSRKAELDPGWARIREKTLATLDATTPKTLEAPALAAAAEWKHGDEPGVSVWWVEAYPTANAVRIRSPRSGTESSIAMTGSDLQIARDDSKHYVFFSAVVTLPPAAARDFAAGADVEVALEKGGTVVTGYQPVIRFGGGANEAATRPASGPKPD